MMSRCVAVVLLASCASAREVPPDGNPDRGSDAAAGSSTDASLHDAATVSPDAAVDGASSSGSCSQPFTGVLATWTFTGAAGGQASTTAASTAPGVTAGAVTRAGVTAVSGLNSINASNWPTQAQLDPAKYYTLTLTPPAGCTLTLTSAAVDGKSSSTGPTSASLATSVDTYVQAATVSTTAASTPALTVTDATATVELRVHAYGASSTSGTFRLQNSLSVTGSVQ